MNILKNSTLRTSKTRRNGFTLVELLVVLVILGLLAGLVGPAVLNQLGGAKSKTAKVQVENIQTALETFMLDTGRFPTGEEGLKALVSQPGGLSSWNGPYLKGGKLPKDPWGNDYQYRNPGEHGRVDVFSFGADGQPGGEGEDAEVGNWQL